LSGRPALGDSTGGRWTASRGPRGEALALGGTPGDSHKARIAAQALDRPPGRPYIPGMTDPRSGESAAAVQARLAEEFQLFDDWMDRYQMLIDMGKALDALPERERRDDLKVPGCQSQVWLKSDFDGARLSLRAASDAIITSGLIALLLQIYSGRTPREILDTPFTLASDIGLAAHLTPGRANGLANMVRRIREAAAAHA